MPERNIFSSSSSCLRPPWFTTRESERERHPLIKDSIRNRQILLPLSFCRNRTTARRYIYLLYRRRVSLVLLCFVDRVLDRRIYGISSLTGKVIPLIERHSIPGRERVQTSWSEREVEMKFLVRACDAQNGRFFRPLRKFSVQI